MFRPVFSAAVLSLACAFPVLAKDKVIEVPITKQFTQGSLGESQGQGALLMTYHVLEIGGVPMVCGAYAAQSTFMIQNKFAALRKGWDKANGNKVIRDLTFFANLGSGASVDSGKARCKPLGVSGKGKLDLKIGFDPIAIRM